MEELMETRILLGRERRTAEVILRCPKEKKVTNGIFLHFGPKKI
jgi:hypothetical protein